MSRWRKIRKTGNSLVIQCTSIDVKDLDLSTEKEVNIEDIVVRKIKKQIEKKK